MKITMLVIWSFVAAILFLCAVRADVFSLLTALHCEGFGCLGTGLVVMGIGGVLIPSLIASAVFVFSTNQRVQSAVKALVVSSLVMWTTIAMQTMYIRHESASDYRKSDIENLTALHLPASQHEQRRPLLDSQRPLTIVNQLEQRTSIITTIPYNVKVYACEDALLQDGTLAVDVVVMIPQSNERRTLVSFALHKTEERAKDGRVVLEGSTVIQNIIDKTEAMLVVTGKDGVRDILVVHITKKN